MLSVPDRDRDDEWVFGFKNYSTLSGQVTVEVDCVPHDPRGPAWDITRATKPVAPAVDEHESVVLACDSGSLPIGHGFEDPDAGKPGVANRLVADDVHGRKEAITIENVGTAPFDMTQYAICVDKNIEIHGHDAC